MGNACGRRAICRPPEELSSERASVLGDRVANAKEGSRSPSVDEHEEHTQVSTEPCVFTEGEDACRLGAQPLSTCVHCGIPSAKVLRCGVCKTSVYCSVKCQRLDWRQHKLVCKSLGEVGVPIPSNEEKPQGEPPTDIDLDGEPRDRALYSEAHRNKNQTPDICKNCGQSCIKVFRCGVCKAVTYCKANCQKDDWPFHKRLCKKPKPKVTCACGRVFEDDDISCRLCHEPRPDHGKAPAKLEKGAKIVVMKNRNLRPCTITHVDANRVKVHYDEFDHNRFDEWIAKDSDLIVSGADDVQSSKMAPHRASAPETVCVDEDVDDWYRHREWKPSEKREFVPSRIENDEECTSKAKGGSSWNAGGTWEERDMIRWWNERLASLASRSFGEGRFIVERVGKVMGDAAIVYIRGEPRRFFDLNFEIDLKTTDFGDAVCTLRINDFCNGSSRDFSIDVPAEGEAAGVLSSEFAPHLREELRQLVVQYENQV